MYNVTKINHNKDNTNKSAHSNDLPQTASLPFYDVITHLINAMRIDDCGKQKIIITTLLLVAVQG